MSLPLSVLRQSSHTTSQFVPLEATAGLTWSLPFAVIRIGSGSIPSARLFRRAPSIPDPNPPLVEEDRFQTTRKPSSDAATVGVNVLGTESIRTPSGSNTLPAALTREA